MEVGSVALAECGDCAGVWITPEPFEQICAEREQQAAVMSWVVPGSRPAAVPQADTVRYLACPECQKLMNRVNFARYSGVIMDVCKSHGTFFDRDELHRVISFIREGGLDTARSRERERLVQEQQRLCRMEMQESARQDSDVNAGGLFSRTADPLHDVLKHLFDMKD
ncbi:MAG: zf-TFIIB domain-containing protein [Anaerolineae bacterium]|nr:zf-TFIIB domain-containing protein [Gemmatimonadaceae bacterium]